LSILYIGVIFGLCHDNPNKDKKQFTIKRIFCKKSFSYS